MKRGIFLKIFIAMALVSILDDAVRYEQNLFNFIWPVFLIGVVSSYIAFGITMSLRNLRFERDRMEAIIKNLSSGLIMYNEDYQISLVNPEAEKLLGLKAKDIADSNAGKKSSPENAANIEVARKMLRDKTGKPKEFTIEKPEYKVLQATTVPLGIAEKKKKLYVTLLYDVTHEREIDQLKSDFISIASHQLRTPLSVVKWLTKMILTEDLGPLNKEQKDYLGRAYESNERMVGLVNDLLNVSRIEEGKLVFKEDEVRINDLIKEVLKAYEIVVAKNKLTLTLDSMKEDAVVRADKEKLYMAFSNVIDNAIKFTPRGGQIAVTVKRENDQIVVAVTDSGIGISPKDQTHLFEKFFRAENARLVHTEGSGLGLFIIKNIIERHGGTVDVRSELQKGTTVVCTLPIQKGIA